MDGEELRRSRMEALRVQELNRNLEQELLKVEQKYEALVAMVGNLDEKECQLSSRLQDMIYDLFNKEKFSDVLILLDGGHSLYGHKLVLAARSEDWGINHLEETQALDLTDIRYDVAYALIKWVYTGEINPRLDDTMLLDLLQNSVKYRLEELHLRTQKILISKLNIFNCKRFLEISDEAELLKEACSQFMAKFPAPQTQHPSREVIEDSLVVTENDDFKTITSKVSSLVETRYPRDFKVDDTYKPNRHPQCATKERNYKCNQCDATYTSARNLRQHKRKHTGERPFRCDVCGKSFSQKNILTRHSFVHSGERPFKCEICGKAYTQSGHLAYHMQTHSGNRNFKCRFCEKSFITRVPLRMHERIHTKEKPFQCMICDKKFARKNSLKVHLLCHSGVKSFKCEICEKSFTKQSLLYSHKATHLAERPFKCQYCDKSFGVMTYLKKHTKKIHLDKDSFKCTECDKTYNCKDSLNCHMKSVHCEEKQFKCHLCPKEYGMKKSLVRHLKSHNV